MSDKSNWFCRNGWKTVYTVLVCLLVLSLLDLANRVFDNLFKFREIPYSACDYGAEYKATYDLFDRHFSQLLAILSGLFTVFGLAIPAGAYLLQRQSLKDERERTQKYFETAQESMKKEIKFLRDKADSNVAELTLLHRNFILSEAGSWIAFKELHATLYSVDKEKRTKEHEFLIVKMKQILNKFSGDLYNNHIAKDILQWPIIRDVTSIKKYLDSQNLQYRLRAISTVMKLRLNDSIEHLAKMTEKETDMLSLQYIIYVLNKTFYENKQAIPSFFTTLYLEDCLSDDFFTKFNKLWEAHKRDIIKRKPIEIQESNKNPETGEINTVYYDPEQNSPIDIYTHKPLDQQN